jgi:hypothetical protein
VLVAAGRAVASSIDHCVRVSVLCGVVNSCGLSLCDKTKKYRRCGDPPVPASATIEQLEVVRCSSSVEVVEARTCTA